MSHMSLLFQKTSIANYYVESEIPTQSVIFI